MNFDCSNEDWWNDPHADAAVNFVQTLRLGGDFRGEKWVLEPWQQYLFRRYYGLRDEDDRKVTKTICLWCRRKVGKSTTIAGLCVCQMVCGPPAQEILVVCGDHQKAEVFYLVCKDFIKQNPRLNQVFKCSDYYKSIKLAAKSTRLTCAAIDSDVGNAVNISTLVLDELHCWSPTRARKAYNALTTSSGARKKGRLVIETSTAGQDTNSLAYDLYSRAKKIKEGKLEDPSTLALVFESPREADWTSPQVWREASPSSFIDFAEMTRECEKAQQIRSLEYGFKQMYLNQWINYSDKTWIKPEEWDRCAEDFEESDLYGKEVYVMLDLSSVIDLTSLAIFEPESQRCLSYSWTPKDTIEDRMVKDGVDYQDWVDHGYLFTTTGGRIVHSEVASKVNEILANFKVEKFVMDPAMKNLILPYLDIEPEDYRQNVMWTSPPSKYLETAIAEQKIKHRGEKAPVLAWAVSNTIMSKDNYENIYPSKSKSNLRIDPCVALICAIGAWMSKDPLSSDDLFYAAQAKQKPLPTPQSPA